MINRLKAKNAPNSPNLPNFCVKCLIIKEIMILKSKFYLLKSWERLGKTPEKLGTMERWEGWDGVYTPEGNLKTTKIF